MNSTRTRYPGAQPFTDDPLSNAVFFGRDKEVAVLTDQITANRLVVVYAKSGVGKTSLIQAGTCPLLRDDNYVPLMTRVNDTRKGPLRSVFAGIEASAGRQDLEYHAGSDASLWHFFKTVEFWKGDVLQTPVLFLDQFEELFTLHPPEVRDAFLAELGYLVRGVRPAEAFQKTPKGKVNFHDESSVSDSPPQIRIVISLREDFVGFLEEAADRIPQILSQRFRLTPLTIAAAKEAMTGPSSVDDERFSTRPFRFHSDTIQSILEHLSGKAVGGGRATTSGIEPFQLQLVCQRVENLVSERQQLGEKKVMVTTADLGGEAGLNDTLRDFYSDVLQSIPEMGTRRKVSQLCRNYLISPTGRRLSLEESEIERTMSLEKGTLNFLVNKRLLRSDQRADSTYFELSHDSLVEPVLAASRVSMTGLGMLNLLGSIILCIFSVTCLLLPFALGIELKSLASFTIMLFFLIMAVVSGWMGISTMRKSVTTLGTFSSSSLKGDYAHSKLAAGRYVVAGWTIILLIVFTGNLFLGAPFLPRLFSFGVALIQLSAAWQLLKMRNRALYLFLTVVVLDFGYMIAMLPNEGTNALGLAWSLSFVLSVAINFSILTYIWLLRRRNLLL